MIKANKGTVKIKGNGAEMLADFTTIAKSIGKIMMDGGISKEYAKAELKENVDMAFMSDEELTKHMANGLLGFLKDICNEESEELEHE